MADHAHLLIEGLSEASDLAEFAKRFKQCSSYRWKAETGYGLWQRGYFERVLRDDEDTFSVAAYIIANPVRAGLVVDPLTYPFLGSGTMKVEDLALSVQVR